MFAFGTCACITCAYLPPLAQVHTLHCVPDTWRDARYRCLACVSEDPRVRFYAGEQGQSRRQVAALPSELVPHCQHTEACRYPALPAGTPLL